MGALTYREVRVAGFVASYRTVRLVCVFALPGPGGVEVTLTDGADDGDSQRSRRRRQSG